jgi:hypothetical protein
MLLQIAYAAPVAWWTVFLPLWIGHGGHLLLVLSVLLNAVGFSAAGEYAAATMNHGMDAGSHSSSTSSNMDAKQRCSLYLPKCLALAATGPCSDSCKQQHTQQFCKNADTLAYCVMH